LNVPVFPFSAIVGQDDLKLALVLNALCPSIGGVLVRGDRGTAKSTAVRALRDLLSDIEVVAGCPCNCDPSAPNPQCPFGPHAADSGAATMRTPLIELPLGAGADGVAGSLDIERALSDGRACFRPGLLASAHRGILYVDEVNLLPDHLVDLLLDAAAMGVNRVERDGISVAHPCRFALVGTMNPQEGELRPQLLDRFGIAVDATRALDPPLRAEVVRRRLAFEADPDGFRQAWEEPERDLRGRLNDARSRLPEVELSDGMLDSIVAACSHVGVEGLRADVVTAKTARALAAWRGRGQVDSDDVRVAARLALAHRTRLDPLHGPALDPGEQERALSEDPEPDPSEPPSGPPRGGGSRRPDAEPQEEEQEEDGSGEPPGRLDPASSGIGEPFEPIRLEADGAGRGEIGRRSGARIQHGSPVDDQPALEGAADLSLPATLRAAAPHQHARGRVAGRLRLRRSDVRRHVREGREGNLIVFVVDASGSMAARRRMTAVKGAVMSLLRDAYKRRDRVCLITFCGETATLVLPPTAHVDLAVSRLRDLPVAGKTPLAAGLCLSAEVIAKEATRDPTRRALMVLVTDGRANHGRPDPVGAALQAATRLRLQQVPSLVVDTQRKGRGVPVIDLVARALAAPRLRLEELRAESMAKAVRLAAAASGRKGRVA
jgi:magnesium chelatase subunit D